MSDLSGVMEMCPTVQSERQIIKQLFHAAIELPEPQRAQFVAQSCAGNEGLRLEVESLISAHGSAAGFIEAPPLARPAGAAADADSCGKAAADQTGRRIGAYEIVRQLGVGGMGTVYLAVRADDQYRGAVAIKLVGIGIGPDQLFKRFLTERQILANLDHPNIARLLDGGSTDDGVPYLVMEYVRGVSLTEYAGHAGLDTNARLKLFLQICAAVSYAHKNLVVHRDIKPSNILVTDQGVPKLLDFGIAKLLDPAWSSEHPEITQAGARMMTPGYSSPEQMLGQTVTTSTDLYSLGVVLYELLSGRRPYELKHLVSAEAMRVVCETEPERPSVAVTRVVESVGAHSADAAPAKETEHRQSANSLRLSRSLAGDLDNIVLKALRKDPARRYGSVDEFAQDIGRHLAGLPVLARADTFRYRTTKFIARHRVAVLAGAVVVLLLLTSGIFAAVEARNARRARDTAQRRFDDVHALAYAVLFDYQDQIAALPGSTKIQEQMVRDGIKYLDALSADSGGDPRLQRELALAYMKVGGVQGNPYQTNLGDQSGALASYRKALAIEQNLLSARPNDPDLRSDVASAYSAIADMLWATGDNPGALESYRKALTENEALAAANPGDLNKIRSVSSNYYYIGQVLMKSGRLEEAKVSIKRALELDEKLRTAAPTDRDYLHGTAVDYAKLGDIYSEAGDTAQALVQHQLALKLLDQLASTPDATVDEQRTVIRFRDRVALDFARLEDFRNAELYEKQALEAVEKLVKADADSEQFAFDLADYTGNMGRLLFQQKRSTEAIVYLARAVRMFEEHLATNKSYSEPKTSLAALYGETGDALAATGDLRGAIAAYTKSLPLLTAEPMRSSSPDWLADAYFTLGSYNVKLALKSHGARAESIALWRAARDWYVKSVDTYSEIQSGAGKSDQSAGELVKARNGVVECEKALSGAGR